MKILRAKSQWFYKSDLRFDAEYHLGEGPATLRALESGKRKTIPLMDATLDIFKGNIFKRIYVDDPTKGYPFISASDMVKAELEPGWFVSRKFLSKKDELEIKQNWILVSRSGTLGQTVYTNANFSGIIGSDDLIRIIPNEDRVLPGYLYAFLASRYGYALLTQSSYGGVIKHIEPHHLVNIPVPIFDKRVEKKIDEYITVSATHRCEASKNLKKALYYFDSQFDDINEQKKVFVKDIKSFAFSWVGRNNDVVANAWQRKLKNKEHITIKDVASEIFAPPLFKHIYLTTDNGYPFFTGSELAKGIREKYRFLSKKGVKNIADYQVRRNTLVVYKSGPRDGMIGSTFLVDSSIDGGCLSDHVIRVKIADHKINNWVFAFLRSKAGKRTLHNLATGTAILFITPDRVGNIRIPFDPKQLNKISLLVDEYLANFEKAQDLESKAISIIEKEILSWQK
jgi:type I restriction enzyme S subunit